MVSTETMMKPSEVDPTPEPIWYFQRFALYKGKFPPYYDVSDLPGTSILRENFERIRDEIVKFYTEQPQKIPSQTVPYAYEDPGWKTHTLYAFGFRHSDKCRDLPFLDSVIQQIPGVVTATVSVLEPHTRIHAHVGASSAVVRTHLAILVPGELPDVGIRVRRSDRGWTEGELFGIEMAHRHYAWNNTDKPRIALTVDTIKEEYANRIEEVCGRCLSLFAMQMIASKLPVTRRLPRRVIGFIHGCGGIAVQVVLRAQRIALRGNTILTRRNRSV